MGMVLDYPLPLPVAVPAPAAVAAPHPLRWPLIGSALLHLAAFVWFSPLGGAHAPEVSLPSVLQVNMAPAIPKSTGQASRLVQQPVPAVASKAPSAASKEIPAAVTRPSLPSPALLSSAAGSASVAVSSAVTTTESSPAPLVASTSQAGSAGKTVAESGEEAQPASENPAFRQRHKPVYPLAARKRGIEGTVRLRIEVLPNGEAGQVLITQSSGDESLDDSARNGVRLWRFNPALKGGKAVAGWVNTAVVYTLENDA